MPDISLFDAIHSQRAIRYLKPDPIPDEVMERILDAAIHAPSGSNSQPWAFVVVRGSELRQQLGALYKDFWDNVYSKRADPTTRVYRSAQHLAGHFGEAPAVVIPCIVGGKGTDRDKLTTGASIYPAVQNLMLAALAEGVGSVITTFLQNREDEVKQLLRIPAGYQTTCAVPLGYPSGEETFGGSKRKPLAEVVHYDGWQA